MLRRALKFPEAITVASRRCYTSKNNESVLLADALNLLSPSATTKAHTSYKPSIFTSLTKGPVSEQQHSFKEFQASPRADFSSSVNHLLSDLNLVSLFNGKSQYELLQSLPKELKKHIRGLTHEDKVVELAKLFFYQNRLSFNLLVEMVLNRNMCNLKLLPFDVAALNRAQFAQNGWKDAHYTQFYVILLKKYHDMRKPLLIIKNLKDHFESAYLPLIEAQQLTSFYERIVWKFYFEYLQKEHPESLYIRQLNSFRSTMLIWELSQAKSSQIARQALSQHKKLNPIQEVFLRIAGSAACERMVAQELEELGKMQSALLTELKKLSIKHKIYEFPEDMKNVSPETRQTFYFMINATEGLLSRLAVLAGENEKGEVSAVAERLRAVKKELLSVKTEEVEEWDAFFAVVEKMK